MRWIVTDNEGHTSDFDEWFDTAAHYVRLIRQWAQAQDQLHYAMHGTEGSQMQEVADHATLDNLTPNEQAELMVAQQTPFGSGARFKLLPEGEQSIF